MKQFIVLNTLVAGYSHYDDEYRHTEQYTLLVPSRNNNMIEYLADLLMEFIDINSGNRCGDSYIENSEQVSTTKFAYGETIYDDNNGLRLAQGPVYTMRLKSVNFGDESSLNLYVFAYSVDLAKYSEADPYNMYDTVMYGLAPYGDRREEAQEQLIAKLHEHGLDIVDFKVGLQTFCLEDYDNRDCGISAIPIIQKISGSLVPLYKEVPQWTEAVANNLASWAWDGDGGIDDFSIGKHYQEYTPGMDMAKAIGTANRYGPQRWDMEADGGLYGWVQLIKVPIVGKTKPTQS